MQLLNTLNQELLFHYAFIFFIRHWLVGIENGIATVVLGVGLLWLIRHTIPPLLRPSEYLAALRCVYIVALYKSALFLILGDKRIRPTPWHLIMGFQWPDPGQLLTFNTSARLSIWSPTSATLYVSVTLILFAMLRLIWRAVVLYYADKDTEQVQRLNKIAAGRSWNVEMLKDCVKSAAIAIRKPQLAKIPIVVFNKLPGSSPFIIGLLHPKIAIAQSDLETLLGSGSLEAALRHELMHVRRSDIAFRWIQMWLEDIARITLFGRYYSTRAISMEEQLCDTGSIHSLLEAASLANAIEAMANAHIFVESQENNGQRLRFRASPTRTPTLDEAFHNPGLLGLRDHCDYEDRALVERLISLKNQALWLKAARQADAEQKKRSSKGLAFVTYASLYIFRLISKWAVYLLLFFILYVKVFVLVNVP